MIGEGGMGVVLAATHLQLDEPVALKFLRKDVTQPEIVARFTQEARAAVKLKSEYVARTYDVGVEDGDPYIVMEYLDGHDLGQELEASGTLPIDIACSYMVQACAGVAEAHARGIVHRDIKPENIFIATRSDGSPVVKILDFGISHAVLAGAPGRESRRSTVLGSPFYISPEQLGTGEIDFRADIWSLGAVMFELLAGVRPFDAPDLTTLLRAIGHESPRKLSDYRPMVPHELDLVIQRCLEKSPAARFQSAAELAVALLKFAPRHARVAADRAMRVARAAGMPATSLPPSQAPPALSQQPAIETRLSSATPSGVAAIQLTEPAPPAKDRRPTRIALGIAATGLVIGAIVLLRPSAPVAPPPPKAAAVAPAPEPPKPPAPDPAPPDTAQAAPSSSADPAPPDTSARRPPPPVVAAPQWRPKPSPAAPSPPPSPPPGSRPDLDIRMSR
jgi:serine/threonine-protein kinase